MIDRLYSNYNKCTDERTFQESLKNVNNLEFQGSWFYLPCVTRVEY